MEVMGEGVGGGDKHGTRYPRESKTRFPFILCQMNFYVIVQDVSLRELVAIVLRAGRVNSTRFVVNFNCKQYVLPVVALVKKS